MRCYICDVITQNVDPSDRTRNICNKCLSASRLPSYNIAISNYGEKRNEETEEAKAIREWKARAAYQSDEALAKIHDKPTSDGY